MSTKGALLRVYGSRHASKDPENILIKLPSASPAVRSLRPRTLCRVIKQYEVKQDGTKDYTTIGAAISAAQAFQTSQRSLEGVSILTPNYTVEVIVHPGTYIVTTPLSPSPYVPIISKTGIPGDVIVKSLNLLSTDLGTVVTAADFYMEGIDIVRAGTTPTTSGKYCQHISLADYQTGVYVNCRFYTETSHSVGGWTCVGMDGNPGATLMFYGCEFWSKVTGTYAGGDTNLHGMIGGAPAGSVTEDTIFVNSIGGNVGYNALSSTATDSVWASGGAFTAVVPT